MEPLLEDIARKPLQTYDSLAEFEISILYQRKILEPEKKLFRAVLEDAILAYQNNVLAKDGKSRALFREAEEWILDNNSDYAFSFNSICSALGLNPPYLRGGLIKWKEKAINQHKTHRVAK